MSRMGGLTRQEEYPAEKRPIVLGAFSEDPRHKVELNPIMMNPGPRLKQVVNKVEEVLSFELKVASKPTGAQTRICRVIQYAVYWIAEQHRENENEYVSLHLQHSFFEECKNLWQQWISLELDFCKFSETLQLRLRQVCEEEYFDVFEEFGDWASLREKINKEVLMKSNEFEDHIFSPCLSEVLEVNFICNYSVEALSVLSRVTDSREATACVTQEFENDADVFCSMFCNGAIDKSMFDNLIFLRFRASCPAASSICILSESEKENLIHLFETQLACCVQVELTAEQVRRSGNCTFCLEEIKVGQDCLRTPCLHMFHTKCMRSNLFHNGNCPNCRQCLLRASLDFFEL